MTMTLLTMLMMTDSFGVVRLYSRPHGEGSDDDDFDEDDDESGLLFWCGVSA